jgi:hypothetical protein
MNPAPMVCSGSHTRPTFSHFIREQHIASYKQVWQYREVIEPMLYLTDDDGRLSYWPMELGLELSARPVSVSCLLLGQRPV